MNLNSDITFSKNKNLRGLSAGVVLKVRYLVERELGRGGIGIVYLARDEKFNRPVVVKLLLAELARNQRRIASCQ